MSTGVENEEDINENVALKSTSNNDANNTKIEMEPVSTDKVQPQIIKDSDNDNDNKNNNNNNNNNNSENKNNFESHLNHDHKINNKKEELPWYAHTPVSLFAAVMGINGLAVVWKKLSGQLDTSVHEEFYQVISVIGAIHFILFTIFYLIKFIKYPKMVGKEFSHPIKANFFPAWDINLILFSILLIPDENTFAEVLFWIGSILQLLFTLKLMSGWFEKTIEQKFCNPTCLIPVVGNVLSSIPAAKLEYYEFAWFVLSIGIIFWIIMLVNNFSRLVFHGLPDKLIPTMFILIAPPAITCIGYSEINKSMDGFGSFTFYVALFFFILMISAYKVFMPVLFGKAGFQMPFWAFTFPMDALAVSAMQYHHFKQEKGLEIIAWILFILANIVVVFIYTAWLVAAKRGKVFAPEN